MRYLDLLGPLEWGRLPERNLVRDWGQPVIPNAAFLAACLIKLEDGRDSMGDLLVYLCEHPALIWLLGFPLSISNRHPLGFDPQDSLPTERSNSQYAQTGDAFGKSHGCEVGQDCQRGSRQLVRPMNICAGGKQNVLLKEVSAARMSG